MFTLYVVRGRGEGYDDYDRAIASWGDLPRHIIIIPHGHHIKHWVSAPTPWYGFIHGDEVLSDVLADHMSSYLFQYGEHDCFVFLKKMWDWRQGRERLFKAPRVFSNKVVLEPGSYFPEKSYSLKWHTCLDGFLYDANRYSPIERWDYKATKGHARLGIAGKKISQA